MSSGVRDDVEQAVARATDAFHAMADLGLDRRYAIIQSIRDAAQENVKALSVAAVEETGLGRAADKVQKNLLCALKTPGPEILDTWSKSGDHGLTIRERAPHGVIGSIIPTTNPTETVINNTISMLSGGNAVVFNAHPAAASCSNRCVDILDDAVQRAGGPAGLVSRVETPSIETAKALMVHDAIALICVTGGPGVVKEAMGSGKKVIGAGPGNPPAVVDETADIALAARDIVAGASIDNNIICTSEKEAVVVDRVCDELIARMVDAGCVEVRGRDLERVMDVIFEEREGSRGRIDKRWVGKNAGLILNEAGIDAGPEVRLVLCEVPTDHPLPWTEQLLPVFPIVRVGDVDQAIDLAVRYEGGRRHTATMHSERVSKLSAMARSINCSIFVKNGPTLAGLGYGGEGHTSFTIASPTGEGMTTAIHFTRERRCTLVDSFRIV